MKRWATLILLGLLVLVTGLLAPACAVAGFCQVSAPRPARTFYPDERVGLTIRASGEVRTGRYTVTDYYGTQVTAGKFTYGGDTAYPLGLGKRWPLGFYVLRLTSDTGEVQDDAFCVIPRADAAPGDYGIFSWHYSGDRPEVWTALSQVGCRIIRRDLAWPNVEPAPGQWDLTLPRRVAALARQNGIQLLPILGYSPRYMGIRPVDAVGRPAIAWHCWATESTTDWPEYMRQLIGYLGEQQLSWPTAAMARPQQVPTDTLPLVHSWEMWNEADQGFYYGYWGRYLDLLRLTYDAVKRAAPWGTVLYGGSCGHWTELGMTYNMNSEYFFDRLTIHPGGTGSLDGALETYYTGAPQIGNGYGLYRDATMTECYPFAPPGLTYAQYMPQLYATLRKWRVSVWCMADGWVESTAADDGTMFQRSGPDLLPRARYAATAVARWQLGAAHYVGPLYLGSSVEAYLYTRQGRPLVVAWASAPTTVSLRASAGACVYDEMGRATPLRPVGGLAQVCLGPVGCYLWGLDQSYYAEALRNQAELYLSTPQGFPTTKAFGYIGALQSDAAYWGAPDWPAAFRAKIEAAAQAMIDAPLTGGRALGDAQDCAITAVDLLFSKVTPARLTHNGMQSTVYRLQTVAEWLGEVQDDYGERWGVKLAAPEAVATLRQNVEALRASGAPQDSGLSWPVSLLCLRRAHSLLAPVRNDVMGLGAYRAAQAEYAAAQRYQAGETPVLTGVVAAPDFLTATQLVKTMAVAPGPHQVRVYVHNYTTQAVSGTLVLKVPASWNVPAENLTAPFTAPAGGRSEGVLLSFTLPGGAGPWPVQSVGTAYSPVNMQVPEGLEPKGTITVGGTLADGRQLLSTDYLTLVGVPVL